MPFSPLKLYYVIQFFFHDDRRKGTVFLIYVQVRLLASFRIFQYDFRLIVGDKIRSF